MATEEQIYDVESRMRSMDYIIYDEFPIHEGKVRGKGRAVVWAARRLARSKNNHGFRRVFLIDNLPLALGITKGRAASEHTMSTCRCLCAVVIYKFVTLLLYKLLVFVCCWVGSDLFY